MIRTKRPMRSSRPLANYAVLQAFQSKAASQIWWLSTRCADPHPLLRGQNSVQRRIEQTEPVVGRPGQRLDGVLGVRHQPDHAAVG